MISILACIDHKVLEFLRILNILPAIVTYHTMDEISDGDICWNELAVPIVRVHRSAIKKRL